MIVKDDIRISVRLRSKLTVLCDGAFVICDYDLWFVDTFSYMLLHIMQLGFVPLVKCLCLCLCTQAWFHCGRPQPARQLSLHKRGLRKVKTLLNVTSKCSTNRISKSSTNRTSKSSTNRTSKNSTNMTTWKIQQISVLSKLLPFF